MTFPLRIRVAQINPTIGDIDGNVAMMIAAGATAARDSAHVVVFPELSVTGYYPGDLLDEPGFEKRVSAGLARLLEESARTPGLHWVVGAPVLRHNLPGKRWENQLLVLNKGDVVLTYSKQLLPTYNVFDERRHFEPGDDVARVLNVRGTRIGFLICEDGWADAGKDYATNPLKRLRDAAPDVVVSINASPSNLGKAEQRARIFSDACRRYGFPLVYANQVGGHDQLVYDGGSFAMNGRGDIVDQAKFFETDALTLEFDGSFMSHPEIRIRPEPPDLYRQQIVLGLRDYARRCGFTKAVVGCSGGIDSAVTLALAVEALGPQNVVGITMPSVVSSHGSVSDSQELCNRLGITLLRYPIAALVKEYQNYFGMAGGHLTGVAAENIQARIRGTVLMGYSNQHGHLLLTTGNKSENAVGYCTLYGDTNGGLGLIGDLYKTEVFALARHLNRTHEIIPAAIIDKPPSAELSEGQKDTDSLPPYEVLDEILKFLIEGSALNILECDRLQVFMNELECTGKGRDLVIRIRRMIARSEYKRRQAPPIIRVRPRAFGPGRQMPIAAVVCP